MSNIDWSKHQFRKQKNIAQQQKVVGGSQTSFYKNNNLWSLRGKHYGTHIHNLPLDYLNWMIDNYKTGSYKQQAIDEIYRRYQELI